MAYPTDEGGGGPGGAGLSLGPETNAFTGANLAAAQTARNTYATANADWLAEYNGNRSFLITLTYGTTVVFQRRNVAGNAWENAENVVQGPRGPAGTPGGGGGATAFLGLSDTPSSFGTAGQVPKVNSARDGLEFADDESGGGGVTGFARTTLADAVSITAREAATAVTLTAQPAAGSIVSIEFVANPGSYAMFMADDYLARPVATTIPANAGVAGAINLKVGHPTDVGFGHNNIFIWRGQGDIMYVKDGRDQGRTVSIHQHALA